jgi:hypothetical protein
MIALDVLRRIENFSSSYGWNFEIRAIRKSPWFNKKKSQRFVSMKKILNVMGNCFSHYKRNCIGHIKPK